MKAVSPRSEERAVTATAVALVAVGCVAWWLAVRPVLEVDAHVGHRMLHGLDDIGITLGHADDIDRYEGSRPAFTPVTTA